MFVPGNYLEMVIQHSVTGWPPAFTILHFHYVPEVEAFTPTAQSVRNTVVDATAAHLAPVMTNQWGMVEMVVTDRNVADGQQVVFPLGITGTQASDSLPPGTSILVRWHGAAGSRANQGRTFFPGMRENDNITGGLPSTGIRTVFAAWGNEIIADGTAVSHWLAVVSKRINGATRAVAEVNRVGTCTIGTKWARQKRRATV